MCCWADVLTTVEVLTFVIFCFCSFSWLMQSSVCFVGRLSANTSCLILCVSQEQPIWLQMLTSSTWYSVSLTKVFQYRVVSLTAVCNLTWPCTVDRYWPARGQYYFVYCCRHRLSSISVCNTPQCNMTHQGAARDGTVRLCPFRVTPCLVVPVINAILCFAVIHVHSSTT